ncbi:MAG TPA: cation diffusion facilitator family transporter [Thermoplasmata archaeon]
MEASQEKVSVARLSVYSNSSLVILKVVVGILTGSVAIMSEAIHSGIDLLAALIARYSVKKSAEPADNEHRYGHGKYENLSGMIEGSLIFVAAVWIIYESVKRFFEEFELMALGAGMAVMALSAILNFFIARRIMKVAKKTESLALEADAYHLMTDVWTSAGVFAGLVIIQVTGFVKIDPAIALVVAAFITHAAYDITRRASEGLLDTSLPEEELKVIEGILKDHDSQFLNFHRLRTRKVGPERHVDLHLTVPRDMSVKEGHDFVDHLEQSIRKALPNTVIVVHIEPCNAKCEECKMAPNNNVFAGSGKTP